MNQTKLKYARERLNALLSNKKSNLRKEASKTKPYVVKFDSDAKDDQILRGTAKFSLPKFRAADHWDRSDLYRFMDFKEPIAAQAKFEVWERKQSAALNKLQDRFDFIEEELMLGDEEAALKLIRDFAKE